MSMATFGLEGKTGAVMCATFEYVKRGAVLHGCTCAVFQPVFVHKRDIPAGRKVHVGIVRK